jgi:hypothetical protein
MLITDLDEHETQTEDDTEADGEGSQKKGAYLSDLNDSTDEDDAE